MDIVARHAAGVRLHPRRMRTQHLVLAAPCPDIEALRCATIALWHCAQLANTNSMLCNGLGGTRSWRKAA